MSTSEEIHGFDPKHEDHARTQNGGKVLQMYEKLIARGEEDKAEELRRAHPLSNQMEIVNQVTPEFDPKHDDWRSVSRGGIVKMYEWLVENGHEEDAENLRQLDTVREQKRRVGDLKDEYDISHDDL
jgi:hypothetical protein